MLPGGGVDVDKTAMGGLRISHDTYRRVRGVFDVTEEAPLPVKGIVERSEMKGQPRVRRSCSFPNEGLTR